MRRTMMLVTMAVFAASLVAVGPALAVSGPPPPIAEAPNKAIGYSWLWGGGTRAFDGSMSSSGVFINIHGISSGQYEYTLGPPEAVPPGTDSVPGGKLQTGNILLTYPGGWESHNLLCNPFLRQCLWMGGFEFGQAWYTKHWYKFPLRGGFGSFTEVAHFLKLGT